MMKVFGSTHILLFLSTVAFLVFSMWAVSKMNRVCRNIAFVFAAFICAGGIFFRYGLNFSFTGEIYWQTLAVQLLQVCNFNFILVILMLVPKFELARQYSIMFSMFAASTTLVSVPSDWATRAWNDPYVLNSWLNHTFAIALPLWMLAARRLKPRRDYVWKVTVCVIVYFTTVTAIIPILRENGIISPTKSFSFTHSPEGIGVLEWLYRLIPFPCAYLLPLVPIMVGFFLLLAKIFKHYHTEPFGKNSTAKNRS